ncbi:hypothetical protein Slala03_67960 [Streptomyces lavendulae subsp. lavendulae]|uniref:hypothetical protein n=1 Tax=Streptomyces lavendulae TaxID=1914 RepID=UPI0024A08397|nr:hypothetical protein [Streptomyces lavendulae]GLV87107.1 hypothetical protein Slala03_67960 [Streptomyces lavendulae subsp. lavendulae]
MPTGAHGLREHGFAPVVLPPVPAAVTAGFRDHPYRTLRLRMSWTADDDWLFQYVPPSGAPAPGGPVRDLADRRLAAGLGSLLRRTLSGPWLDVHADWLIGLHRIRTVAPAGTTVRVEPPEPPPADATFTLLAVLGREGAGSLRSRLYGPGGASAPLLEAAPRPGQGLLLDRRTVTDDLHELLAGPGGPVSQDLLTAHLSPAAGPASSALRIRPMLVRGPSGTLLHTRPALR